MSTVFNRCYAYHQKYGVAILGQNERNLVGKEVASAYHQSGIKKPIRKGKSKENEGTFTVLYYPPEFTKQIDAIIANFYANNSISDKKVHRGTPQNNLIARTIDPKDRKFIGPDDRLVVSNELPKSIELTFQEPAKRARKRLIKPAYSASPLNNQS